MVPSSSCTHGVTYLNSTSTAFMGADGGPYLLYFKFKILRGWLLYSQAGILTAFRTGPHGALGSSSATGAADVPPHLPTNPKGSSVEFKRVWGILKGSRGVLLSKKQLTYNKDILTVSTWLLRLSTKTFKQESPKLLQEPQWLLRFCSHIRMEL